MFHQQYKDRSAVEFSVKKQTVEARNIEQERVSKRVLVRNSKTVVVDSNKKP